MPNPLAKRFPAPSLAPHPLAGPRLPGITPESTEALQEVLIDNHQRWHIFFNNMGFHNHASHRALALWDLGANAETIRDGYKRDCGHEKPAIQSPQEITEDNFDEHLGDDTFYSGYVEFFAEYIDKHGIGKALEDWVFSNRANIGREAANAPGTTPNMLARFLAGVLHPMIHAGYGAEFNLQGMMAEGLALTAVHSTATKDLIPASVFDGSRFRTHSDLTKKLGALEILAQVYERVGAKPPKQALKGKPDPEAALGDHAEIINELVAQWELDVERLGQDEYLQGKIEDLVLLVVSMYGVSGWTTREKDQPMRADFLMMHLVTSSIFLPSLAALLSPTSRGRLLHAYISTAYAIYAGYGPCRTLDFNGFYNIQAPASEGLGKSNPWLPIIEHAIEHHDEHVTKTHRALAAWASHFGSRRFGVSGIDSAGLSGAEKLDGALFLRTAQLTVSRVGPPIKEHRPFSRPTEWDFPFPAGPAH